MDGKKPSKKSKNLKNVVLTDSENIEKVKQRGKVNKKTAKVESGNLSITPNNKDNKNKKAAKLSKMIQDPVAAENVRIVQKGKEHVKAKIDTAVPIESKSKKNKKQKKSPKEENNDNGDAGAGAELGQSKSTPKTELSDVDLKKIEKKKAKKAAQKLKKAQRKEMLKSGALEGVNKAETDPIINVKKKSKKAQKKLAKNAINNSDGQKEVTIQKTDQTTSAKPIPTVVTEHVLNKKIRKEQKRKNVKEQKLAEKSIRSPAEEEATVFVGNLPVNTKRVQIVRLFEECGRVNFIRIRSAAGKVLLKHKARKAAGSLNAYVVLENKSAAEKALQLNGVDFKGNHLRITKSSKKTNEQRDDEEAKRTIFVGNLRYSATEENLREIFSSCGEIESVRCIRDGDKGCKGVAYICFRHADAVGLALELKDTILDERPIHVERYSVGKLGAKEQRDAQAAKEKKSQFQKSKRGEKVVGKSNNKKNSKPDDVQKKSKKSEFRGVKVDGLKKKNKKAKKSQFSELAKKIAPKVNN